MKNKSVYVVAEKKGYILSHFKTNDFHKALNCVMDLNAKRLFSDGFYFFYKIDIEMVKRLVLFNL